ncbi:uncharacterized protein [Magallana gigas]|uniref:uncharacterized protein isoform X3 n=1 Tax=Magallana gigas TaxID=29159 RepID=UPI003340F4CB
MAAVFLCVVICLLTCCSAYENLALNKPAREKYPYADSNTDASKAVDGLKTNLRGTEGQCSLSAQNQRTSTWWVNLTSTRSIHDIRIYYRTDNVHWDASNGYTARFLGFSIYVSNTTNKSEGKLCYKDNNFTRSTIPAVFNTTCFEHGQYVIYYNERLAGVNYSSGYSDYAYNDLCEVEVYGCPSPGYYGINCTTPCPDVNCGYCHIETGTCQGGCKPGYKGHRCELECDGNMYGENCSKSCGNCKNSEQCHHIDGTCMKRCENGYQGLKCDKECDNGTYGNGCDKTCGHCVNKTICYHVNGTCFEGCDPGYRGSRCHQECTNNKYGDGCQINCGHCFNISQCHHINGTCFDGCDPGYEGQTCNHECQNRTYGHRCQRQCAHCLNRSKCDHIDGTCLQGCEEGYGGRTCNLVNLALRKPAYQENIYRHANVSAGNAVDGRKSNLNGLGGECSISAEKQPTATWWVNLESIYSIHNIRIYYRTENLAWGPSNGHTARFLGFSIYVSNTTNKSEGTLCYKDRNFTRSTIPAVFNTTCIVHGQYVIYYNERLPGVTYPSYYSEYAYNELCEVEVYGNLPCPDVNCRYCHIETGTCQGCIPGYRGHQCELECDNGWYGDGCQKQCGHCLNTTQCDHVNGTCSQGCELGYEGETCAQECQDGYFGENCARECPANCNSCNKTSGLCDLGCHPGWKGTHCTEKCNGGLFGANCSTPCGHCLNNQQCHHLNGTCAKGCDPGYIGDKCTEECDDYKYGENCSFSCGNCENNEKCSHIDGTCTNGCDKGYQSTKCDTECDDYRFGKNCSKQCGHCFNNSSCHHINGTCVDGCDRGYQGTECMQQCSKNTFGRNCQEKCRTCITCDIVTGICDSGCHPGWKGDYCENACDGNFYGANCSLQCGKCRNNTQCHNAYGNCTGGCASGFNGTKCDTECHDGYFGPNCRGACNETCKSCNKTSGVCEYGCKPGWKGDFCETICDELFYGENCSVPCGNCLKNEQCHHLNGTCFNGCMSGFMGSECIEECQDGYFGENCIRECPDKCYSCNKSSGICDLGCHPGYKGTYCTEECDGGLFGVNCSMPCGHCRNNQQCHHINGTCADGCDQGYMGDNCTKECMNGRFGYDCLKNCSSLCVNRTCEKKTGSCKQIATQTSDSENNASFVGVGVGLLILLIASVLVFVIVRRHRKSSAHGQPLNNNRREDEMKLTGQGNSKINTQGSSNGRPAIETTPLSEGMNGMIVEDPEYFNVTKTTPDIAIDKLEAAIAEKGKNDNEGFRKEYAALPSGELHTCEFGKKPENVPKNRYKTTFPYDHSRVVLDTQGGEKSDYIHANYIEGPNRKKEYIAAQGPKPNTLGDFWRMIWQERVTTIVMVTNLKEGEKHKCNKYWPDKDKPATYGPVLVTLLEEKEYAFYTTRQLSVYNKELKNTRVVTQYHYTAWPDHGVPEPLGLLSFHSHVMNTSANNSQGPTTVHCSAGVGRTGTYIALDALFQMGKGKGIVNVAEFVAKMRQNRVSMVQTYEQYITIFLALNEIFKAPIKADSMAEFSSKANKAGTNIPANQNPARKEFQLLSKIRPNYTKDDYKFAINSIADKQAGEILPLDKYSLHLSTGIPKRGSYINAITVSSFTNSQGFIVTKYPAPEDAVDLLRLLNDHESDTVVSLQPLRYIESSHAWFPAVSSSLKIPPYSVTHQSKSHTDITSHVIQIHKEGDEDHTVTVIEPDAEIHCSGKSSVDTSQLRSLVLAVLNLETKNPITILSSDGASLCGLFVAVHNVIQQMNMDDRVDVFTAVRQLQIRRPEFCAKFEEYEMIYRTVLDYNQNESESIYCNQ